MNCESKLPNISPTHCGDIDVKNGIEKIYFDAENNAYDQDWNLIGKVKKQEDNYILIKNGTT